MKTIFATLLVATGLAHAAPNVAIRGIATTTKETLTLDLFADTEESDQLRSFGLSVDFDQELLQVNSLARHQTLWFLSPDGGVKNSPYAPPSTSEKTGAIELLGLRFDGTAPTSGITGKSLLLATVVFDIIKEGNPSLEISLARPAPFDNFVLADGTSLDDDVTGLENATKITFQDPVIDTDQDGLPDSYETETFGSINVTKGTTDFDQDCQSDFHEWLAGTDPTDRTSFLKLEFTMQPDGTKHFRWDGHPGRIYNLIKTTDLTPATQSPVIGALPGTPNTEIDEAATSDSRSFYFLKVTNPTGH